MHYDYSIIIVMEVKFKNPPTSNTTVTTVTATSGWSKITVTHKACDERLEIEDVFIDGKSIKEIIYTSKYVVDGTTIQPCTELWGDGVWSIWLHNNYYTTLAHYRQEFGYHTFGQDKFSTHIVIEDRQFNSTIDYMNTQYPPRYFDLDDAWPWFPLGDVALDFSDDLELFLLNKHTYTKGYSTDYWANYYTELPDYLETVHKLLDMFNTPKDGRMVDLMELGPHGTVEPHIDHMERQGSDVIYYIPLNVTKDNILKFYNVGSPELVINEPILYNRTWAHAAFNNTNQTRYAFAIGCPNYKEIAHDVFYGRK